MNTRRATQDSAIRQERWASSPGKERGLLANLVGMVASGDPDLVRRQLRWWIQSRSWQPGGLGQVAEDLLGRGPSHLLDRMPSQARRMKRIVERGRIFRAVCEDSGKAGEIVQGENGPPPTAEELVDWMQGFCLDPEFRPHPSFLEALAFIRISEMDSKKGGAAEIGNLRQIWDALEYCGGSGEPVLIEGPTGCGKSVAAQAWCACSGGIGRYVATPPGNDVDSLARAIATALGSAHGHSFKKRQVEERLRQAFRNSPLVLVLDDAWKAWPSGDCREAHPKRIQWLVDLMESGVRIAFLTSPQWVDGRRSFIADTGYMIQQFDGRIGRIVDLGKVESKGELEAVAAKQLPNADGTAKALLAYLAGMDPAGMHAIRHAVREAEYRAQKAGRAAPESADIREAVESSRQRIAHQARHDGAPSATPQQAVRRVPAAMAPTPRRTLSLIGEDDGSGRCDLARPGILSV